MLAWENLSAYVGNETEVNASETCATSMDEIVRVPLWEYDNFGIRRLFIGKRIQE